MNQLKRIVTSTKVQMGVAGIIGGILAVFFEVDYTEQILGLITTVTGLLIGGQVVLDQKFGSQSDGTTINPE